LFEKSKRIKKIKTKKNLLFLNLSKKIAKKMNIKLKVGKKYLSCAVTFLLKIINISGSKEKNNIEKKIDLLILIKFFRCKKINIKNKIKDINSKFRNILIIKEISSKTELK